MHFIHRICIIVSLFFLSQAALANEQLIEKKLKDLGINIIEIEDSPLAGIKTVTTEQGIMLASEDGNYLFHGSLFDITGKTPVNYMTRRLASSIKNLENEMIIYPADTKNPIVITVFTDVTCFYCQKMHEQIADYNKLGITVRYLAFPRQGMESENAVNMQSIWCMADKNTAFNAAMKGEMPKQATCDIDIGKHYRLGAQMGVTGTPAVVLPNGDLQPGYLPPEDMHKSILALSNTDME